MKPARLAGILCIVLVTAPVMLAANPATAAPPGSWGGAGPIETDNAGFAYDPQVAVDGSGNAVAVWYQHDGTRYNIWANRYVAGTGWGTAGLIETDNAGSADSPQVAVDGSGNAVAVWYQDDGTWNNIWANRYVAGTGWGTAGLIETDNAGSAQDPQVAVDGSGNAVAVWWQYDGTRYNIWANRYVAGLGWGTAGLIETDNASSARDPQVAVDGSGNAVAVWKHYDGTRYNIWANRLVEDYPPALSLLSPVDGLSTNLSTVWVAGVTEPGATLSVNGLAVSVALNGSFGVQLALTPGMTLINATAWDRAGNGASAYANVTFDDPLPALEQDLAATQADLAAAQTNLSIAQSQLAATQANLATTQLELAATRADLGDADARVAALELNASATQADLDAARANLTAAQASVAALEVDALSTQTELSAARADLATAQTKVTSLEADLTATQSNLDAAAANLSRAEGRVMALETKESATETGLADANARAAAASGQVGTAMLVAIAGVGLGAAGLIVGLRNRGRTNPSQSANSPVSPSKEPPPN